MVDKSVSRQPKSQKNRAVVKRQKRARDENYHENHNNNNSIVHANESTPSRMMARLEIRSKVKQPKLFSSKSLGQLIPRKLFFRTNSATASSTANGKASCKMSGDKFSCANDCSEHTERCVRLSSSEADEVAQMDSIISSKPEDFVVETCRVNSDSLIAMPRQSSIVDPFEYQTEDWCEQQPNLSPIMAAKSATTTTTTTVTCNPGRSARLRASKAEATSKSSGEKANANKRADDSKKVPERKLRPLKNTALVLRDVKNSIGLRLRARQDRQAFCKLNEELMTPPSKLYSPFNITDSFTDNLGDSAGKVEVGRRSRRLRNSSACDDSFESTPSTKQSIDSSHSHNQTPKDRIALQHKKHLMNENQFNNFVSPTGKLRETVKDVEHFQQCIEDISKAIRERAN